MHRILITGAAGRLGTILRNGLRGRFPALRLLDIAPLGTAQPGEELLSADIRDHVTGFYLTSQRIGPDVPPRPDTFYGLGKAFAENLGRLYADKHHLEGVCVRIGTVADHPTAPRHLSTWLSRPRRRLHAVLRQLRQPARLVGHQPGRAARLPPPRQRRALGRPARPDHRRRRRPRRRSPRRRLHPAAVARPSWLTRSPHDRRRNQWGDNGGDVNPGDFAGIIRANWPTRSVEPVQELTVRLRRVHISRAPRLLRNVVLERPARYYPTATQSQKWQYTLLDELVAVRAADPERSCGLCHRVRQPIHFVPHAQPRIGRQPASDEATGTG